ncbi:unnamed protein product [Porites lobata]|uniref:Mab-21-like HhH/H2TH-like domain-containing protein n=1 Tax=Porites lobata TaxID=104759 RepID=A0ABN8NN53_9CNID|nr:unnamed protein product [Porites lobata]
MTMKVSELAREIEGKTDSIIISLMDDMKALSLQSKDLSEGKSSATSSNVQEMKTVLGVYENVIQKLWKIAENIAKTSAAEETHAGTVFMGSSGDGTYLPEISDTFDVYVMEEDSQYQLQTKLKAVDPDFERSNPNHTHLLKVLPTEKPGYYFLTWSEYGLERKRQWEERRASQQACGGANEVHPGRRPIIQRLIGYSQEIKHEGKTIQVISPYKIRQQKLKNPPTSVQGLPVWFRMQDRNSPAVTVLAEEHKNMGKTKIQVTDLVLGTRTTMPCLQEKWIDEKRGTTKWLKDDLLEKLRDTKCSVVAKSWESQEENLSVWRISFSGLERECVSSLPPEPKICLIIMKGIRRKFLSKPKGLISYHMKTVLFHTLDKIGSDWKISDRAENILRMLAAVAEALKSRSLPLYFDPRLNTLESMDAGTAAELGRKVQEIIRSPRVLLEGCLFQSMDEDHNKEHFEKGKEVNPVWFDERPPELSMFGEEDLCG